jgi:hypothetical protein
MDIGARGSFPVFEDLAISELLSDLQAEGFCEAGRSLSQKLGVAILLPLAVGLAFFSAPFPKLTSANLR